VVEILDDYHVGRYLHVRRVLREEYTFKRTGVGGRGRARFTASSPVAVTTSNDAR